MNEKEPNPEQLLKMLDAQMQASRLLREKRAGNRVAFRVLAIAVILVVLIGSLCLLMVLAQNVPKPKPQSAPSLEATQSH